MPKVCIEQRGSRKWRVAEWAADQRGELGRFHDGVAPRKGIDDSAQAWHVSQTARRPVELDQKPNNAQILDLHKPQTVGQIKSLLNLDP